MLTSYTLGSLALWWLAAFPVYDRYLHTLAPLLLILLARVIIVFRDRFSVPLIALAALVMLSPLIAPSLPIAGEARQWAGIDQMAAALNTLPPGTVLYDHWLGWELGFYRGANPANPLIWEPTVDDLIVAIRAQPGYLVLLNAAGATWLYALHAAGLYLADVPLYHDDNFSVVYVTTVPSQHQQPSSLSESKNGLGFGSEN